MKRTIDYALPEHLAARRSAKRREWMVQAVAGTIALLCFVGAGLFIGPLKETRQQRQLVVDPDSIKGLPPDIALLGKLGTFRALAIDWASIRAERLKEQGKTYEALQLHLTVCHLAPRFPNVWINAAWNMAYNISVSQYTAEARWQWVQNGIKLLRDEGIQYNPKSASLYKELTWIYWHKIGDFLDDEHLNYKKALGVEMERVLGAPPVTVSDEEYFDWFREIVTAPRELEDMIERDPAVKRLVSRLATEDLGPDETLLEFVARHVRPELQVIDLLEENQADTSSPMARRLSIVRDAEAAEAMRRLLAAVRSKVLRERHKFDLDRMMDLMENRYGPLDWRNGFSHALYWSSLGDEVGRTHEASGLSEKMTTARFVFFSLQSLIGRGKLILRPDFDRPFDSYVEMMPDTRYIPYLFDTYLELGKEHFSDHPKFKEGTPGPIYMTGLVTSMHHWIELLYLQGGERNLAQAENYFAWLRENNPHPDGSTQGQYLGTIEQFVMGSILEKLMTYKAATGIIRSFIRRALKQYSLGESTAAVTSLKRGRLCYDFWMADTRGDRNERRMLQPYRIIVRDEIEAYLKAQEIDPLFKARLWRRLPLEQRQMVYDRLSGYFERLCSAQEPPWALPRAFPEPVGMQEFRQTEVEIRGQRQEELESGERYKQ
jgi:hypothetical protein